MQWSLFLFILMGSFLTCQQYEYHLIKEKKTWKEAQAYCREKYTDLATVYNMTDMERLLNSAENQQVQKAWIGLHNVQQRFQSPEEENQSSEAKVICGKPTDERWVVIWKHGSHLHWRYKPCTEKNGFICYDEKNSFKKFHVINEEKTWLEAQSYCREHHTDLVKILNWLQVTEIIIKINKDCRLYWVGLFRDTWRWSDGSPSSFRHWYHIYFDTLRPQPKCAMTMLNKEGGWKTDDCDEKKSFFCYDDKVILIRENKTWEEALYYCRDKHHDLVSITNLEEQRWIQEKAKMADSRYVWLGLRYTCTLDFWFWVSDEVVSYKNWDSDGKKDECDMSGAMERGGEHKWIRHLDNEKFNFICSKF